MIFEKLIVTPFDDVTNNFLEHNTSRLITMFHRISIWCRSAIRTAVQQWTWRN